MVLNVSQIQYVEQCRNLYTYFKRWFIIKKVYYIFKETKG